MSEEELKATSYILDQIKESVLTCYKCTELRLIPRKEVCDKKKPFILDFEVENDGEPTVVHLMTLLISILLNYGPNTKVNLPRHNGDLYNKDHHLRCAYISSRNNSGDQSDMILNLVPHSYIPLDTSQA
jgi:hypothetical protein